MKNITVSVDDETYRRARITAAERGRSVSAMVREYLGSLDRPDEAETTRREAWQQLWERVDACQVAVGPRPTRGRTYDTLYTQDLNHGQDYDGVHAVDPFLREG